MLYTTNGGDRSRGARGKGEERAGEIESAERKAAFWRIQQSAFLNQEYERDLSESEDAVQCCLDIARMISRNKKLIKSYDKTHKIRDYAIFFLN